MSGEKKMKENNKIRINPVGVGILTGCALVWYSVYNIGFVLTLLWLVVLSAIVGIGINLWNNRY